MAQDHDFRIFRDLREKAVVKLDLADKERLIGVDDKM